MTADQIERQVKALGSWFHNIDLKGVQTAPDHFLGDYPTVKWNTFKHVIPADLTGKSVLDIGCNAGFYSIEMKKRGAARVVAIDSDEKYLSQARFAAAVHEMDIEFRNMNVYEVRRLEERFDLVIFMGVLYHLRHPLLALDLLHEHVTKDMLLFQSMQRGSKQVAEIERNYQFWETGIFDDEHFPRMHFIEHEYSNDWTNWWVPNRACVEAMLRSSGFDIVDHPEEEVYLCKRRDSRSWEVAVG
jgi:tRNA (mo5U34)-methyltransferase